jgi:Domain of unknown function (DUF4124)
MKKTLLLAAQLTALMIAPLATFADIYQWKDDDGKIQYSDQPPPDRPARLVKSGGNAKLAEADKEKTDKTDDPKKEKKGPKSLQEQDQDFRKRKIDAEKAEKAAAEKAAENKKSCNVARNNLKTIEESSRVYKLDEKGERAYLDDKGLAKETASTKAEISKYCS